LRIACPGEHKLSLKKRVGYLHLIYTICSLICCGDIDCRVDAYPDCNFQIFAVVSGVTEALMKMSAFYHAYCHVIFIKKQESVGRLVLPAAFLIV
jgi:hypothetical protein